MYTEEEYHRVIPRDLFNESKLLKCVGRLSLFIHDNHKDLQDLKINFDSNSFNIGLFNDGSLFVKNVRFSIGPEELILKTTYNSKENYPLVVAYKLVEYPVFDNLGGIHYEFKEVIRRYKDDLS